MAIIEDITCSETSGCFANDTSSFLKEDDINSLTGLFDNSAFQEVENIQEEIKGQAQGDAGLSFGALNLGGRAPLNELAIQLNERLDTSADAVNLVKKNIPPEGHKHMKEELEKYQEKAKEVFKKKTTDVSDAVNTHNSNLKKGPKKDSDGNDIPGEYEYYSKIFLPPDLSEGVIMSGDFIREGGAYNPNYIGSVMDALAEAQKFVNDPLKEIEKALAAVGDTITGESTVEIVTQYDVDVNGKKVPVSGAADAEKTSGQDGTDSNDNITIDDAYRSFNSENKEKTEEALALKRKTEGGIYTFADGTKGHYDMYADGSVVVRVKEDDDTYSYYRYDKDGELTEVHVINYDVENGKIKENTDGSWKIKQEDGTPLEFYYTADGELGHKSNPMDPSSSVVANSEDANTIAKNNQNTLNGADLNYGGVPSLSRQQKADVPVVENSEKSTTTVDNSITMNPSTPTGTDLNYGGVPSLADQRKADAPVVENSEKSTTTVDNSVTMNPSTPTGTDLNYGGVPSLADQRKGE